MDYYPTTILFIDSFIPFMEGYILSGAFTKLLGIKKSAIPTLLFGCPLIAISYTYVIRPLIIFHYFT